jgi:hypothetical protein
MIKKTTDFGSFKTRPEPSKEEHNLLVTHRDCANDISELNSALESLTKDDVPNKNLIRKLEAQRDAAYALMDEIEAQIKVEIGKNKKNQLLVDYRKGDSIPTWIREVIETHLSIEREDAKSAGSLGFMSRALVIASMPYKDPKADSFTRQNGDFKLRILAGYEGGIPYGIYPRLLMSWVATEAVRTQSPWLELGDSLGGFLRDVLDLSSTGGKNGTNTRVGEQMKRLFGSLITAQYTGSLEKRGFMLRNILIADELEMDDDLVNKLALSKTSEQENDDLIWQPQPKEKAGAWQSKLKLSDSFFKELIECPVPIDLRAYKILRGSPLAMDIYAWLTYRLSYTQQKTRPIPWVALMNQFGSNITAINVDQARRDFKRAFLSALQTVLIVYPKANLEVRDNGLVLSPSPTHVELNNNYAQKNLF